MGAALFIDTAMLILVLSNSSPHYLQACTLVRERRAEETCDNAHDGLGYVTLQHGIRMFPVAGGVAHLKQGRQTHITMRYQ